MSTASSITCSGTGRAGLGREEGEMRTMAWHYPFEEAHNGVPTRRLERGPRSKLWHR